MKPSLAASAPLALLAGACTSTGEREPVSTAASGRCPDVLDYSAFRGAPNRRIDFRS